MGSPCKRASLNQSLIQRVNVHHEASPAWLAYRAHKLLYMGCSAWHLYRETDSPPAWGKQTLQWFLSHLLRWLFPPVGLDRVRPSVIV